MLELIYAFGVLCAGACSAVAVTAIGEGEESIDAMAWLERRRDERPRSRNGPAPSSKAFSIASIHSTLAELVSRAGWKESPERLAAFAVGLSACLAMLGAAAASMSGLAGAPVSAALGFVGGLG